MRPEISALLDRYGGVVTRALRYAGEEAALSHTTGLSAWDIPVPVEAVLHVVTDRSRRLRHARGLAVHHRQGFVCSAPAVLRRGGLELVQLEGCLVDSWALPSPLERRVPMICAVQRRRTTAARIAAELERAPKLPARAELADLLKLLELGCHSELEIWGYRRVFDTSLLPPAQRQRPVLLALGPCTSTLRTRTRWSRSSWTEPPTTSIANVTRGATSRWRQSDG